MSEDEEIRTILDQTADAIAGEESNPRPWLAWIVYLLDRLELKATDVNPAHQQDYRDMLAALRDAIKIRLQTGGW